MAEANWYVVHTYSGYENKVKADIEKTIENRKLGDQILDVVVPMQDVVEVKNGVQKETQKKLFPGYVLINMIMNDDTWYVVRNTRGVTGFVGPGSKPVHLTEEEMKPLGIKSTSKVIIDFEEGDSVSVVTGAWQMKDADTFTIDTIGIPSMVLMERAAYAFVCTLKEKIKSIEKILVVCGSGNNGGDGFAAARMLVQEGYEVHIIFAGREESCTKETKQQKKIAENLGISISGAENLNRFRKDEYSVIIDALFGIGINRRIEGTYQQIVEKLNQMEAYKAAMDIPSGINGKGGITIE